MLRSSTTHEYRILWSFVKNRRIARCYQRQHCRGRPQGNLASPSAGLMGTEIKSNWCNFDAFSNNRKHSQNALHLRKPWRKPWKWHQKKIRSSSSPQTIPTRLLSLGIRTERRTSTIHSRCRMWYYVIQGDSRRLVKTTRLRILVATARWFLVAFNWWEILWRVLNAQAGFCSCIRSKVIKKKREKQEFQISLKIS